MTAVWVNGEERAVPDATTVAEVVEALGSGSRGIAVVVNAEVVPRSAWATTPVAEGDRLEVLRAAQGGC